MKIFRIKILANYKKSWAVKLAKTLRIFLQKHGFVISRNNIDATICIGGDGTIFYANHKKAIHGAVLGIGSESSVVCQLKKNNWKKQLLHILGNPKIEKRLTLTARTIKKQVSSLNDVVIHTHDYRVITIFIDINNRKYQFEGDGIIISTPTGSSAYAYSAGGKILKRDSDTIQVVPICAYKRSIKPMLLDKNARIKISCDRSADFIIDGIFIKRLKRKEHIIIKRGEECKFLVNK